MKNVMFWTLLGAILSYWVAMIGFMIFLRLNER